MEKKKAGAKVGSAAILIRVDREGLTEKGTFERRSEGAWEHAHQVSMGKACHVDYIECQGHGVGRLLACFRVRKGASQ